MRNRQYRIEFRLNEREFAKFDRAVRKSGLSYAPYVRHLINGRIPKDKPPLEYEMVLKELRSIVRSIDQIALAANRAESTDSGLYDERYNDLQDLILELIKATEMPTEVR